MRLRARRAHERDARVPPDGQHIALVLEQHRGCGANLARAAGGGSRGGARRGEEEGRAGL
eukprot:543713-Prymnesium_polylepis.1